MYRIRPLGAVPPICLFSINRIWYLFQALICLDNLSKRVQVKRSSMFCLLYPRQFFLVTTRLQAKFSPIPPSRDVRLAPTLSKKNLEYTLRVALMDHHLRCSGWKTHERRITGTEVLNFNYSVHADFVAKLLNTLTLPHFFASSNKSISTISCLLSISVWFHGFFLTRSCITAIWNAERNYGIGTQIRNFFHLIWVRVCVILSI